MAVLLNGVTVSSNPVSLTGVATETAVAQLIEIPGDSVFTAGAEVVIQISSENTAAKFSNISILSALTSPGNVVIEVPIGHFVRALARNLRTGANITCNMFSLA